MILRIVCRSDGVGVGFCKFGMSSNPRGYGYVLVDFALVWDWIYRYACLLTLKRDKSHLVDLPYLVQDLWGSYKILVLLVDLSYSIF